MLKIMILDDVYFVALKNAQEDVGHRGAKTRVV